MFVSLKACKMKLPGLFIMFISFFSANIYAQITNGDFESWASKGNYEDPSGWVSTNGLTLLGNPLSVKKSNDAHSGTYACEMTAIKVINKFPGVFIPDYTGGIYTGSQIGLNPIYGIAYSLRPALLKFYYKYNARNNDTASVSLVLSHWNTSKGSKDTIAFGFSHMKDSMGTYSKNEITLQYFDTLTTPDTLTILFSAITLFATHDGASLLIDDVTLSGGNVGIGAVSPENIFSIFPNPSNAGKIFVKANLGQTPLKIELLDLEGQKTIILREGNNGEFYFETSTLSAGCYFLHITSDGHTTFHKLLIY